MTRQRILIWLPSPLGDAIMATAALRALRRRDPEARLVGFASPPVRQVLSPCPFVDEWIDQASFAANVAALRAAGVDTAVLMKNSFGCALAVWLAGIGRRIGYARDGRSLLLTDRIEPFKKPGGGFKPTLAVDYYLRLVATLGADTSDRATELVFAESDANTLREKLPAAFEHPGPLIVLVPGGAFGPSKCWPSERFARAADTLIEQHNAQVVISIAPNEAERTIANAIRRQARHPLISLGDSPLPLGALKALIGRAALVITNDTGPRHIACALGRPVVSLFGPNNPEWTRTGYAGEIQIVGRGPCVPCDKPVCKQPEHVCMESITVGEVLAAAETQLAGSTR